MNKSHYRLPTTKFPLQFYTEPLDGRTPSEEAGITIEGDNKWLTLIHKAVQYRKAMKV